MRIDFHSHQFPESLVQKLNQYYPGAQRLTLPGWSIDNRLREMEEAGVDIEILSCPQVYTKVDERSPEICRLVNDAIAGSCRQAPDHFKGFAHVPFNDMPSALAEMRRALDDLGFAGVMVNSNVGGRYLHTPEYLPFWEEADRRGIPVFMHPTDPPQHTDDEMPVLLAYEFDITLSATKLIYSGLYENFPDLVLILAHLGGAMPLLARRIDIGYDVPSFPAKYKQIPHRPSEYTRKLYFETGFCWYKPAFDCAVELVGFDQILYGTDHFSPDIKFMEWTNQFLDSLHLSPLEQEKIYQRNAERILKLEG